MVRGKITYLATKVLLNLGVTVWAPSQGHPPVLYKPIERTRLRVESRKRRFSQCGHTGKNKKKRDSATTPSTI